MKLVILLFFVLSSSFGGDIDDLFERPVDEVVLLDLLAMDGTHYIAYQENERSQEGWSDLVLSRANEVCEYFGYIRAKNFRLLSERYIDHVYTIESGQEKLFNVILVGNPSWYSFKTIKCFR